MYDFHKFRGSNQMNEWKHKIFLRDFPYLYNYNKKVMACLR